MSGRSIARARWAAAAVAVLALLVPSTALAYEVPTAAFFGNVGTMPGSGLTQTYTYSGLTAGTGATTVGARGWFTNEFSPNLASATPAQDITVNTSSCPSTGTCSGLGTVTVTFSRPVTDPVIHFAGIGGYTGVNSYTGLQLSELHATFTLTTPGLTLSKANSGGNLAVSGSMVTTTNPDTSATCNSTDIGGVSTSAATAGCGSVLVSGTTTSLAFTVGAVYTKNASAVSPYNADGAADGVGLVVTVPDDYGDAPSSYDAGNAARAALSSIRLGSAVTEDNAGTPNGTSSPNAGTAATGDSDDGANPADFLTTATSYTTTVSLTAPASGQLCAWLDLNRNGVFDSGERTCRSLSAGATSSTLTWTGLSGLTAGTTYARFRIGYNTTQTQSPTGPADSGEVEDYRLQIVAPQPPSAVNDSLTTKQNVTSTVNVLANDTPAYLTSIVASSVQLLDPGTGTYGSTVTIAGQGTWSVNGSGVVTFDPLPTFTGTATAITYRVANDQGQTATATISTTVTPIVPTMANDTSTTAYNTAKNVAVLANDSAGDASAPLDVTTVRLRNPSTGTYGSTVTIAGQGTYVVQANGTVTFTPVSGFTGTATPVTYRVADSNGTTATATLTITVSAPAPAVANPDTRTTLQDVTVTVTPLANDTTDPKAAFLPGTVQLRDPADAAYKSSVTIAGEGTYTVNADGTVSVDPIPTFTGTATPLTYRVSDDAGRTVSSTITVTVTPVTPNAVNDTATTPYETPVTVSPLTNDSPGDASAPLVPGSLQLRDPADGTYKSTVTVPGQGTFVVQAGATVLFTPADGFYGPVPAVTYRVADDNGTFDTATISVTVTEPPASVANPDTVTTPQNVTVTVSPLANDTTDPAVSLVAGSVQLRDPGDGLWKSSVTILDEGTYTANADGTVTFDPVPTFTGTGTLLTYRVSDDAGRTVSSTIRATVTPITPTAVADSASTPYLHQVTVDVLANDTAGAASAPLDTSSVQLRDPADGTWKGTVSIAGEGTYAVQPGGAVLVTPLSGYSGTSSLAYRVLDTNGTAATATLTVVVGDPPLAAADTVTTPQNVTVGVSVLANDTPGTGATFDASTVRLRDPADSTFKAAVTIAGEGVYTVTADGSVAFDPEPGFTGQGTLLTYRVSDTDGNAVSSTLRVTVTPILPTAVADAATTPYETPVNVPLLANDAAGAPSAPLDPSTVVLRDPADGTWKTSVGLPGEGVFAVQADGSVTFTPVAGFYGDTTTLTYRVADANATTATAVVTVTVTEPAASVANPDTATTPQNVTVTLDPLANDTTAPAVALVPGSVVLRDPADSTFKSTVTIAGEGTYTVNPDGTVAFDPVPTFTGAGTLLTYRVSDDAGRAVTSTVRVTVSPIIPSAVDDTATTPYLHPVTVDVLANDSEGAASAPLDPSTVRLQDPSDGTWSTSVTIPGEGTYAVQPSGSVAFTPEAGFSGDSSIGYRVADANGTLAHGALTVTVGEAPTGAPDTASTPQNVTVTVPVLGNDTPGTGATFDASTVRLRDPADAAHKTSVTIAGEGVYTVGADGSVTFDPETAFTGTGTQLTYRVADSDGNTTTSTVTVTVTAVTPTAVDDTATTPYQTAVTVAPLVNDTAGDASAPLDPSTVALRDPADGTWKSTVTYAAEGTFAVQADGSVVFTPVDGFFGPVTPVIYRVADTNGTTDTATIAVTVTEPAASVANPDSTTTPQNVTVTLDVLANDTTEPAVALVPGSVRLRDPADAAYKSSVTVPGEGTYTVNPDGSVTFDPLPGFTGDATQLTYRVADDAGRTVTSTVDVTVTAVTPSAVEDTAATPYLHPVTVDVLANDTAGAASAPLDPSTVVLRDPADGTWKASVTIAGEGTYAVQPDGSVTVTPAAGFSGATSIDYRVRDTNGTATSATLTVTVGNAPTAAPDTDTTLQNVTVTTDVLGNDTPGTGATIDVASVVLRDPADSTLKSVVTIPGEGTYTVNPDGTVTFDSVPAFTGAATPVTYRFADSDGNTATSTLTVTVSPITPTALDDTAATPYLHPVTVDVLANDTAGAAWAPLDPSTVVLRDPADGTWKASVTIAGEGTYAVQPDGSVTVTPAGGFSGATSIDYRVRDTNGTATSATLTVTVGNAPTAAPDTDTTLQDVSVTTDILGNDAPGTGASLDPATVRLQDPADAAYKTSVTIAGEGVYTVGADGSVTFDPEPTFTGVGTLLTYRVADSDGNTAGSTLRVTVTPVTPVAQVDGATTPYETPVGIDILANDSAGDASAPLVPGTVVLRDPADGTWKAAVTIPGEGAFAVQPDGSVTFTPADGFFGPVTSVSYRVADDNGTTTTAPIVVTVTEPPPSVAHPDAETTPQHTAVTIDVLANDTTDPAVALLPGSVQLRDPGDGLWKSSVTIAGEGTTTVAPDGTVTFSPVPAFTGPATELTYRVSDDAGRTVASTIDVTVTEVTPRAYDDAASTPLNNPVVIDVLANDVPGLPSEPLDPSTVDLNDPADGTYKSSVTIAGEGTYAVQPDGTVVFTPLGTFSGASSISYLVRDDNGTPTTATITVLVGPPPLGAPDTISTPQNVTLTLDILANDTPGTGASFDVSTVQLRDPADSTFKGSVTIAGEGVYTVNADGTVTFDPEPAFTGLATRLTYEVFDTDGNPESSTMRVTVTPITPRPTDDTTTTPYLHLVTVDVLANDAPGAASAPLDPSSVELRDPADGSWKSSVTIPGEGTYSVQPDGSIALLPAAGFSGDTSLDYRVRDTNGTAATATVTVTVGAAPVAAADTGTTPQNITITTDVLANDMPGTGATFDVSTVRLRDPGDAAYKAAVAIAGEGVYTVGADGSVTFDPEPGFTGAATPITYRVVDSDGNGATSTLGITVTPIVPILSVDTASTPFRTPVTVDVLGNDVPGAVSAPLDPSTVVLRDPADGTWKTTVTIAGEGTYAVQPDGSVTFTPDPAFTGDGNVTYRVADTNGTTATATVTATVQPPTALTAAPDTTTTPQNLTVTLDPLANDTTDAEASLVPGSVRLLDPADSTYKASVTIPGEGTYTAHADGTVAFDPEPTFVGVGQVRYAVSDDAGQTDDALISVTVTAITPTAADDSRTTPYETPVSVPVLDNDAAGAATAPLDATTVEVLDPADSTYRTTVLVSGEGTYAVQSDGSVTFTPAAGFFGAATPVGYRVADTNGTTATATISVSVDLPPAPVAEPDVTTTPQNVTVTLDPLANDTVAPDITFDPATVQLRDPDLGTYGTSLTVPGEGTFTVAADGAVSFDPVPAFVGTSTPVTYRVTDSSGQTTSSTITVLVTSITPSASDDHAGTPYKLPVTVDVLANDAAGAASAPLDPSTVALQDPSDGTYHASVTVPGEGTYVVEADGSVTFTPSGTFTGTTTPVVYRVADTNGTSDTATLDVTVAPPAMPVAQADTATTPQNVTVSVDPLANDSAGARSSLDPATVELQDPNDGTWSTSVTIPGEGVYTVNPDGTVTLDPEPAFTGDTSVDYRVADEVGQTATSTITVTVAPVTPTALDDTATTPYLHPVTVDVLGNDSEGASSAPLDPTTVALRDPADGTWGNTVTVAGEGTYAVEPDGSVTFTPAVGFAGASTPLTYRVADANGTTASATVTVTVGAAPIALPDADATPQNVTVILGVLANDTPGTGATLRPGSVVLRDPADAAYKASVTIAGEGTYTANGDGTVTFDPLPQFTGDSTVDYRVTDSDDNDATASLTVTVTPITPVAIADSATTKFRHTVTVDVLANDTAGAASAPLDPSTVQLRDPADGTWKAAVTVPGQGTYDVQPDGTVRFTPDPAFEGVATPVTYRVADTNGTIATASLSLSVGKAPVAAPDHRTTPQNVAVTVDPLVNDTPGTGAGLSPGSVVLRDPADGLWKTTVTIPGEAAFTVNPDGTVTVVPEATFTGDTVVGYRVTDSDGNTATSTITVTVAAIVPIVVDDTAFTPFGHPVTIDVLGNDAAGGTSAPLDPSTVRIQDPADGGWKTSVSIAGEGTYTVQADGTVRFVPDPAFDGAATPVAYRVADTNGTTGTGTLAVTVGTAPLAQPDSGRTAQNVDVTVSPLANDVPGSRASLDPSTVLLLDPADATYKDTVTVPGEGTWTVGPTGRVTFDPEAAFVGTTAPLGYRVADTDGNLASSTITVLVTDVVPVATDDAATTAYRTPVTLPVLDNDAAGSASAPLDPGSVRLIDPTDSTATDTVTVPGEGTWTVEADGSITFAPIDGFHGPATPIAYTVADTNGTPATALVSVVVGAPRNAYAEPDRTSAKPGETVTLDPLANDKPSDDAEWVPGTLCLVLPAGATAGGAGATAGAPGASADCVTRVIVPGVGTWVVVDGMIRFTPEDGYSGTAKITYRVTDTAGVTLSSTATVVVDPAASPTPTPSPSPGPGGLAFTGLEVVRLGGLGAGLLLLGLVLVLLGQRRRRAG